MPSSFSFDPTKPIPVANNIANSATSTTVDPLAPIPHLVTPRGAVKVFTAEGELGDKVAVGAFSVSNFGLFAASEQGVGLCATGATLAAQFEGGVEVTGNLDLGGVLHTKGDHICEGNMRTMGDHIVEGDIQLGGADYAEDFDVVDCAQAQPGTVMVLDDGGALRMCSAAYDRRVAGVVSGAGDYKPAVILDRHANRSATDADRRRPLALMGKVYCWVDASLAPIAVGDLLTTCSTPGHAMKAANPALAFGAVIGKALRPLTGGRALVPILVALQ